MNEKGQMIDDNAELHLLTLRCHRTWAHWYKKRERKTKRNVEQIIWNECSQPVCGTIFMPVCGYRLEWKGKMAHTYTRTADADKLCRGTIRVWPLSKSMNVRSCVCVSANDVIVIDTNGDSILNDYLIHIQTESQSKSEKNCEMAGHVRYASVHG